MNERDDYLFDPASAPDPDVAALEQALAPLRWNGAGRRDDVSPEQPAPQQRRPWFLLVAALAAAALALFFLLGEGAGSDDLLREGSAGREFTAGEAPVVIPIGDFAQITLRPDSTLRFVRWDRKQLLFDLAGGGLEAKVSPAAGAGFFAVDTPLGRVIDQGCRFTLDLEDGVAVVKVGDGAVTFAGPQRKVFVPARASVRVQKGGPDTPCFDDAEPELKKAVAEYDATRAFGGKEREMALKLVFANVRRKADSLVLWHLLFDPGPGVADDAESLLRDLAGAPDGGKTKRGSFDPEEWLPYLRLEAWQR